MTKRFLTYLAAALCCLAACTEKDPIELIKWKHLYEQLEASLDSCEHVANIIEGVITKYA